MNAQTGQISPATADFLVKTIDASLKHLDFLKANHDVAKTITNLSISRNIVTKMGGEHE